MAGSIGVGSITGAGSGTIGTQLDRTSKTVGDFLADIALPVSGASSPDEVGARTAWTMALDWLINDHDWEYYFYNTSWTSTASTAEYVIPVRMKSVYSLRDETNKIPILPMRRDLWDRAKYDHSLTDVARFYGLERRHTNTSLTLFPTPNNNYSYNMRYIVDPQRVTGQTDNPDVATYMEEALILRGQGLVTKWRGGQGLLANDLLAMAEDAKKRAQVHDHRSYDEDERLVSFSEHGRRQWLRGDDPDEGWW